MRNAHAQSDVSQEKCPTNAISRHRLTVDCIQTRQARRHADTGARGNKRNEHDDASGLPTRLGRGQNEQIGAKRAMQVVHEATVTRSRDKHDFFGGPSTLL
eukprot:1593268-Pleurochrysis_carterae.AAC.4